MFSSKEFDKFLTEVAEKPNCVIVHPDRYKVSKDGHRVYVDTFLGIICYKDGVCMGEAMNKEDANSWIDENKEIEMWT